MKSAGTRGEMLRFLVMGILLGAAAFAQTPPPSGKPRTIQFTTGEGTWIPLDVSPDGSNIAFELLGDVYLLPGAGGAARAILTGPAFQSQPRFSPNGAALAFISDETGSDNVWIADADGAHAHALTSLPRATLLSPAWSRDGRAIFATAIEIVRHPSGALMPRPVRVKEQSQMEMVPPRRWYHRRPRVLTERRFHPTGDSFISRVSPRAPMAAAAARQAGSGGSILAVSAMKT